VAGALLVLLALAGPASASDWPQFRGPARQGVSTETGLLRAWPESGPRELWRHRIGSGFSSVSVVGDRLYTMSAENTSPEGGDEYVLAFDADTGQELWRTRIDQPLPSEFGDGPRSTPTVQDGLLYTVSSRAKMVALAAADGSVVWQQELAQWKTAPRFGYSASPLIEGDLVIVEIGGPPVEGEEPTPGVAAFDRKSGELRWTALQGPANHSSPIAVDLAGSRQLIFSRGTEVVALSPAGELLWRWETSRRAAYTLPLFLPPDRLFLSTSDDNFGGVVLRVQRGDNGFTVEPTWTDRRMRNHLHTSVEIGGFLYGFDNATFKCLDAATGELQWAKRGYGKGNVTAVGDMMLVLADNGRLMLAPASPQGFEPVGLVQATDGKSWTAPSLSDGRLYLRDLDEIVAYDLRGPAPAAADTAGEPDPPALSGPNMEEGR
jgi:hypothetical protein